MKVGERVVIAASVYENTHDDFKGVWTSDWREEDKKYLGKRTWMPPFEIYNTTCLIVEGFALDIIPDDEFIKRYGF